MFGLTSPRFVEANAARKVRSAPGSADTLAALLSEHGGLQGEMCPGEFFDCGAAGLIPNAADVAGFDASACCAASGGAYARVPLLLPTCLIATVLWVQQRSHRREQGGA